MAKILLMLSFLLCTASIIDAADGIVYKSWQQAIKEGYKHHEANARSATAKVLAGLVLVESSIGQEILLTNVSPLQVKSIGNIFSAAGCFIFASFEGFDNSQPIFHLRILSCVDDAGYAHEFTSEKNDFLGYILGLKNDLPIQLGEEHGRKTIESGTDVVIKLNRDL